MNPAGKYGIGSTLAAELLCLFLYNLEHHPQEHRRGTPITPYLPRNPTSLREMIARAYWLIEMLPTLDPDWISRIVDTKSHANRNIVLVAGSSRPRQTKSEGLFRASPLRLSLSLTLHSRISRTEERKQLRFRKDLIRVRRILFSRCREVSPCSKESKTRTIPPVGSGKESKQARVRRKGEQEECSLVASIERKAAVPSLLALLQAPENCFDFDGWISST
ncbi:unnamed protein product [Cochlearia groenlandica]